MSGLNGRFGSHGSRKAAFFYTCSRTRRPEVQQPANRKGVRSGRLCFKQMIIFSDRTYFESTGICLLIDSSREISVSVLVTPVIACIFSVSTSRRCSLSRV